MELLDGAYPDIEFVVLSGKFGPDMIGQLCRDWNIPANFMFIGCPGQGMAHPPGELGAARVIV